MTPRAGSEAGKGVAYAVAAYGFWGLNPIYFKLVDHVPALEVLAHRVIWSVLFLVILVALIKSWAKLAAALKDRRTLLMLGLSTVIISANWLIYIWAIMVERVLETSLGYYINPLIYVLIGVVFFGERLRRFQFAAVVLATIGVLVLIVEGGIFPWVSLSLAILFAAYGVIRKQVAIGAMPGLFVETTVLFPIAFGWLAWLMIGQQAAFAASDAETNLLLLLAGPITVFPLLFFAIAARRLTLTTIGFMQFLAPTLQFMTGLYYGEELTTAHMICFACIWTAVAFFSFDAIRAGQEQKRALAGT